MNKNIAIIGAQFGDESKGRVTHEFSKNYDFIIRYAGSLNCGHTIYVDGKKYAHHLVPCIDFKKSSARGFLGAGMVIDLSSLINELSALEIDFPGVSKRMIIDPDSFLITPEHIQQDKDNNKKIGTTQKGVGPAYVSKVDRKGLRLGDVLRTPSNEYYSLTKKLQKMGVQFKYCLELRSELQSSNIIFEGAQSVMLDINHGTYPFVTSSDCTVSGISSAGFGFIKLDEVYGICKAYNTRVGNGPFPTELYDEEAELLRQKGSEFGSTTGRPRRVGWMDLPAIRYAAVKGGITSLVIAKLDILNGQSQVPVCYAYDKEPVCGSDFFDAVPKYTYINGWNDAKDLNQIRHFIDFVEHQTNLPVKYVSCGTAPEDLLTL